MNPGEIYRPKNHIRVVTATSLFDGHDAAINIMRRILQSSGVEVIHLGHNRSVHEIVDCALQEDVHVVGLSILSGAHMTLVPKILKMLNEQGMENVKLFLGGIVPDEDKPQLTKLGVDGIYGPGTSTQDIIEDIRKACQ